MANRLRGVCSLLTPWVAGIDLAYSKKMPQHARQSASVISAKELAHGLQAYFAPTDLSAPANHALRYAFAEAASHGAALTLLYVLPPEATTDVRYVHGAPKARGGLQEVAFGHAGFDPESGSTFPMPPAHAPASVRHPIMEVKILWEYLPGHALNPGQRSAELVTYTPK